MASRHREIGRGGLALIISLLIILTTIAAAGFILYGRQKGVEPAPERTLKSSTDVNADADRKQLLALYKQRDAGNSTPCISDNSGQYPLSITEEQFQNLIIFDAPAKRADVRFCNAHSYMGKDKDGAWQELFSSSAPLSSIVVESCGLSDLVRRIDAGHEVPLVNDSYYGGRGTAVYEQNTMQQVAKCQQFIADNP